MFVIRPQCPVLAIEVSLLILRLQNTGKITKGESKIAHEGMLLMQPYRMVGYLSETGSKKIFNKPLYDATAIYVDDVKPGDSFVDTLPTPS